MTAALTPLFAYLLGSIPFGYLIVRWQKGVDVRRTGSGSTGATNVMRNLGILGFVATFLLDVGKGTFAVLLASRLTSSDTSWIPLSGDPRWIAAASVSAILGHCFPVWLKFRGGKGVATGVGVFIALAPLQVVLALLIFAIVVGIWRYISLGSIVGTAAFPLLLYGMKHPPLPIVLGAAGSALIIISMHHANIRRLLNGTESKVGRKKSQSAVSGVRVSFRSRSTCLTPARQSALTCLTKTMTGMTSMKKIAIIGAGNWGTALAATFAQSGHAVTLWAYEAEVVESIRSRRENELFMPGVKLPESLAASRGSGGSAGGRGNCGHRHALARLRDDLSADAAAPAARHDFCERHQGSGHGPPDAHE